MRCSLCGNEINGYGNDPDPLVQEGRCCDACNNNVIKFRYLVTYDNLKMVHPDLTMKEIRKLYEDLRIQTRHKCLMGESI